jgi:hypothetical protein
MPKPLKTEPVLLWEGTMYLMSDIDVVTTVFGTTVALLAV